MDPSRCDRHEAVDRAVEFVGREQRPTGEFPSVAAFLTDDDPEWEDDTLVFITALVVLALRRVPSDRMPDNLVGRAVTFLQSQREDGARWRYWSHDHNRHGFTPPDADDTACASMALNSADVFTRENVRTLLANRDPAGRFYTWLVPHRPRPTHLRGWWDLRSERFAGRRRQELWTDTEAEHDDVDGVVNANVIRYLGHRSPATAVEWVAGLIEEGREQRCDSWYHSPFSLYASVADGHRRGIDRFSGLAEVIEERTVASVGASGGVGSALETALAVTALVDFDRADAVTPLADHLVATQRADGSWPRCVCYHGGPSESFGWASDALTAATAAGALAGCERR